MDHRAPAWKPVLTASCLVLGLLSFGCGSSHTSDCTASSECAAGEACVGGTCQRAPDAGGSDSGASDSGRPDAGVLTGGQSVFGPTAGGGSASSGAFRVQLRVGPAQPVRQAESPNYRLRILSSGR